MPWSDNSLGEHSQVCYSPKIVTGMVVYLPTFFERMVRTWPGSWAARVLRPLFAARIKLCTFCGDMWVLNVFTERVFAACEFFTQYEDETGHWVNDRIMFLDDLTGHDRERLHARKFTDISERHT